MLFHKIQGAGGVGSFEAIPNSTLIIPFVTAISSSSGYLHCIDMTGTLRATFSLSMNLAQSGYSMSTFRYQDKIVVTSSTAVGDYVICNLTNGSVTYKDDYSNTPMGSNIPSLVSSSKIARASSQYSRQMSLDISNETISGSSYTASDASGISICHGTVTFYDRYSTGLSNFNSNVVWTAANNDISTYGSEFREATWNGSSLNASTGYDASSVNYSRNSGVVCNSSYGAMLKFGGDVYRIDSDGTATNKNISNFITHNSNSYSGLEGPYICSCGTSNGLVYRVYRFYNGGNSQFILGYCDISGSDTTSYYVCELEQSAYANATLGSTHCYQINESGYIAVLYLTSSTNIQMKIFNGATQVGTTKNITIDSSESGYSSYYGTHNFGTSDLGFVLSGTNT